MNARLKYALTVAAVALATQANAQAVFYEQDDFEGRSFTAERPIDNFRRQGFNDRTASVEVLGERWEVCEDPRFNGRCAVLRPGRYPSLAAIGLDDGVSSARDMSGNAPTPGADYRRRDNERLYQAQVTSVRAVVGTPEQRCWIKREQVVQEQRSSNVPGAIAGAIIGGILGHQVGAAAARTSPPSAAPSPGLRWAPRWAAMAAHSQRRCKTCSAAKTYPARPNPSFGTSATTFGARSIGFR